MHGRSHAARHVVATLGTALAVALSVSVAPVRADADVTRARTLAPFDRIDLDGAFTATIVSGTNATFAMTGRAEDVARVTVAVTDGTLHVGLRPGSESVRSLTVSIGTATLRSVENAGAGVVHISGVRGDFVLANRGAASIDAAGRSPHLTITNDGVGKIDVAKLDARDAVVTNDGVGSIDVRASGSLVMNVNGIGRVRYAGDPTHVERNVNGFGRIERF